MDLYLLDDALELTIQELDIPAVALAEAIVEAAQKNDWRWLDQFFGEDGTALFRAKFEKDPEAFVSSQRDMAKVLRENILDHAINRLASLSKLNFEGTMVPDRYERIQRSSDPEDNLLTLAFAQTLLDMVKPAALRARKLKELVVNEASSEEADKYLREAIYCYFYGLYTACAVMCRSVIEEVLEKRIDPKLMKMWREEAASGYKFTLGELLQRANNQQRLPADFLKIARKLNEYGSRGAHEKSILESEASKCIELTREALILLLK